MQKRISFHAIYVFIIAVFITAGCAKQEVVKKDEGIAPTQSLKQADSKKAATTASSQTNAAPAVPTKAPDQPLPVQQTQKTSTTEQLQSALNKIYFDFDSADVSESARDTLSKNATEMMKDRSVKFRIEGNCDERGSTEYNLALGERRAKAARKYLVTMGVKPDRLSVISYGEEKPAVQGSDESAWAKNRRDEFVIAR